MTSINVASPKRKAAEPSMYVGMVKICKRCKQSNVKFKFLNNKKQNQPRYQCQDCTLELGKPYHFNPFPIREHNHEDGYAKLPKVETEELKNFNKVCDSCQAENNVIFRGYNNGKETQPRYACKVCKNQFSPLKNSKATSTKIDVSSYEFQTTKAQYQETGASQQPLPYDTSYKQTSTSYIQNNYYNPCSQRIDNHLGSNMDVDGSSNQFAFPSQNAKATQWQQPPLYTTSYDPSQNAGASQWQQPALYNASCAPSQSPNAETSQWHQPPLYTTSYDPSQSQNAGTSQWQQPPLYNTSSDQTSISSQQHGYNYPHNQSSDNRSLASVDVNGSSHQCPFPWQNAEAWQWQQPPLYNTLSDQTSISSQQHGYNYPHNQSSDNRSLASVDVNGSSHQCPFPWQNAEAWQWQQPPLYNTSFDQTSMPSQQQSYPYPYSQSSDNHSHASVDVDGSSNQFPNPSLVAEALRQVSLNDPLDEQNSIPSEQPSYRHPQVQSNNNYPLANF